MVRSPGFYRDYPSRMCSDYYCWFKDQGYPELDLRIYPDGEMCIIQYLHTPLMPSLTRWQAVLTQIRNVLISPTWVKYHADRLNLHKQHVWDEVTKSEEKHLLELAADERRGNDRAEQFYKGVVNNPDLMDRIARNGLRELNPMRMLNHISKSKLGKGYREA